MWSLELHQINDLGCASGAFFTLSLPAGARAKAQPRRVWLGGTALTAAALGRFCQRCRCDRPHGGPRVNSRTHEGGLLVFAVKKPHKRRWSSMVSRCSSGMCASRPESGRACGLLEKQSKSPVLPTTGNSILVGGVGYLHDELPTVGRWRCCEIFR